LEQQVDSINLMQLFSLAKRTNECTESRPLLAKDKTKYSSISSERGDDGQDMYQEEIRQVKKLVGIKRQRTQDMDLMDSHLYNGIQIEVHDRMQKSSLEVSRQGSSPGE
jgi:hypothetical protein